MGAHAFRATSATSSPWDQRLQHGGPVSALLASTIERTYPRPEMRVAQATIDFLGPMPRAEVSVRTQIVRPGRQIELGEATMEHDGRVFALARLWRIRVLAQEDAQPRDESPPDLSGARELREFPGLEGWGYGEAIAWHFVSGGYACPGPADVWTHVRLPLVAGEELLPLERALIVADSANGVSAERALEEWISVPPRLTVTFLRYPAGEWILLQARSTLAGDDIGACVFTLADTSGAFAYGSQPLLVDRRRPAL
ncbi:MAG: thioesterase family protein [Candidatus Tyrphobacter sp.]